MGDGLSILGFSGSLRRGSVNTAVLAELGRLSPKGVALQLADYRELPHFDPDLGEVEAVERLRTQVHHADAVLIATPEYNYSIPGPLKNALDWLSRPAYKSVFAGKPVGVLSASPSPVGGARAQQHLKTTLFGMVARIFPHPEVAIGGASDRIKDGRVVHEGTRQSLARYIAGFVAWAPRQRH
ncbi:MAG: NAD(P)H-dependent oxidoreductase [Myxococcales bacterium]|nr:NAD(P)H-dependent oxidoreductase [Myxococcales bacterium]MDD9967480.1 NAD(P)H-dependent oxidoreductase [Myxococcales bacterium]